MSLIDFAIETTHDVHVHVVINFQPLRQQTETCTCPQIQVAAQNGLQRWTEIEASGEKCEISIKILRDDNSAAPRKYIKSFVLSIFIHSVCLHEVTDSASDRPHPSLQDIIEGCG